MGRKLGRAANWRLQRGRAATGGAAGRVSLLLRASNEYQVITRLWLNSVLSEQLLLEAL